ncbi:MAG: lipase family protein, partial [Candidatus Eremiobacterota bacterium]
MNNYRQIFVLFVSVLLTLLFFPGCGDDNPVTDPNNISLTPGTIVEVNFIEEVTPEQLKTYLEPHVAQLPPSATPNDITAYLESWYEEDENFIPYKVKYYSVKSYVTQDINSNKINVSGLMIMPSSWVGMPLTVPLLGIQHVTTLERDDVASMNYRAPEAIVGGLIASKGYAVVIADYPGMGYDKEHFQPFCHGKSLAYSSVDMLRAGRNFMVAGGNLTWNGQVFLLGYSEGGYVTMATAREIQEKTYGGEFTVTACAPLDGPYDLSGAMNEVMLSDQPAYAPYFLPLFMLGYRTVYADVFDPNKTMKPPYNSNLPLLVDGYHSTSEVNAAMPPVAKEILTDDVIAQLQNPSSSIYKILEENNSYNWTPQMPLRLYHAKGDNAIPYKNAEVA